jgi:glutamate carboxypeptidase
MVDLLTRLSEAESPSDDPESARRPYTILASELQSIGYVVRRIRGRRTGDHLLARPPRRRRGAPCQLLVGHMDTVWPVGTTAAMPVRRDGDALFGPGVFDMKGGLVQLVFALRALAEMGAEPEVTPVALISADEEIGSVESLAHLKRLAAIADRALILESALGTTGKLKTARKGTGWFRVTARGRAAHAGVDPESGLSAILELSHQIQRLFALNDPKRGVTVNVGRIDGGLRPNIVAPEAYAVIDVRIPSHEAGRELEEAIRALTPVTPGVTLEIEGQLKRPPMEPTLRNRRLWRHAQLAAASLGLEVEETSVGGASDGNYTSLFTATLDGLGSVGDGAHAHHEHVVVPKLAERAALLALLILLPPLETT